MYNSSDVATRIKEISKLRGITVKQMLSNAGLGNNMMTMMRTSMPKADNLGKIADVLNCSVDYLLGRTADIGTASPTAHSDICQDTMSENVDNVVIQHSHDTSDHIKSAPSLSDETLKLAQQYDILDSHGKKAVKAIAEIEFARTQAETQQIEHQEPQTKVIPLIGNSFAAGKPEPDFGNIWVDYEVPADSKAEFAIKINGDSMEPYLHDGSIAFCKKQTPCDGEVAALLLDGEFLCKQVCQDAFGNVYLFSLNRNRKDADVTLWSSDEHTLYCFGTVIMQRVPLPKD